MNQETDSAGLPAAPPGNHGAEQRNDRRVALLLRAGKLVSPEGEFLCIVRDASAGGIKARLLHSLPAGGTFDLELANGEIYPLALVWQADGHAGFRFLERPIDVHGLVDEPSSYPKRGLRLRLTLPVTLTEAGQERPAMLRDISQHGAQIEIEPGLAVGQRIALHGSGLPEMQATVRWRRRAAHGLVFQRGFRLDELAELVGRLREAERSEDAGKRAAC